jgi:hypothetical protein
MSTLPLFVLKILCGLCQLTDANNLNNSHNIFQDMLNEIMRIFLEIVKKFSIRNRIGIGCMVGVVRQLEYSTQIKIAWKQY